MYIYANCTVKVKIGRESKMRTVLKIFTYFNLHNIHTNYKMLRESETDGKFFFLLYVVHLYLRLSFCFYS